MSSALDAHATTRRGRKGYATDLAPQTRKLPGTRNSAAYTTQEGKSCRGSTPQVGLFVSAAIPLTFENDRGGNRFP